MTQRGARQLERWRRACVILTVPKIRSHKDESGLGLERPRTTAGQVELQRCDDT